jgi:small subunit ribosomal protein S16
MATKIRLQRNGRKSYAFYSIVIADSRAPRDGKFIEKLGTYNPNTNPATVDLNFDKALDWVLKGAQPTDTVRNILSREGVYMKKHLLGGVKKGAFEESEVEVKFNAWKQQKENKLNDVKVKAEEAKKAEAKKLFEAEQKVNEAKAKVLADKLAAEQAEKAAKEAEAAKAADEAAKAEEKAAEAIKADQAAATEAPAEAAPAATEAPAEEAAPAAAEAPAKEEAPKAE